MYAAADCIHKLGMHTFIRAGIYMQLIIYTPLCIPSAWCASMLGYIAMSVKWYKAANVMLHNIQSFHACLSMQMLYWYLIGLYREKKNY